MTKQKTRLLMLLLLTLELLGGLYWGVKKEGYYIDELWSYGLANSYYAPFLQEKEHYMNTWHAPDFYWDYLTVDRQEAFSYGSVYANQTRDVHPPLYYILLHTVCSLFPGEFSKWFGLSVNLVFFGGILWLLYEIGGHIFGEESAVRLLPALIYGFSGGALSTVMYIRMYTMLTFEGLLLLLLVCKLMKSGGGGRRTRLLGMVALTVAVGFLTQYYFLIFTFFLSAAYVLRQAYLRRWKEIPAYAAAVFGGMAVGVLSFPASLSQIFLGQKGQDSLSNVFLGFRDFWERLRQYDRILSQEFMTSPAGLDFLLAGLVAAYVFLFLRQRLFHRREVDFRRAQTPPGDDTAVGSAIWLLSVTLAGYFCVVAKISTDIVDRYQFIIYPAGVLAVSAAVYDFLRRLKKEKLIWGAAALALLLDFYGYGQDTVHYIAAGYEEARLLLSAEYRDAPGIYVTPGDHLVIHDCLFLAQQERTYPIAEEELGRLPCILQNERRDKLVLYVNIYYDEWQTAETVAALLDYPSVALLYDNTYTQIFVLSTESQ